MATALSALDLICRVLASALVEEEEEEEGRKEELSRANAADGVCLCVCV